MHFFNPLCTGGLFHCYMMDESICHFRGAGSVFLMKNPDRKQGRPDQTPRYVASDLDLHCLPMTLFTGFQVRKG